MKEQLQTQFPYRKTDIFLGGMEVEEEEEEEVSVTRVMGRDTAPTLNRIFIGPAGS